MGVEKSVIQLLVSLNNLTSHCFQLLEVILQGKELDVFCVWPSNRRYCFNVHGTIM